jgi:hypothetical protein
MLANAWCKLGSGHDGAALNRQDASLIHASATPPKPE